MGPCFSFSRQRVSPLNCQGLYLLICPPPPLRRFGGSIARSEGERNALGPVAHTRGDKRVVGRLEPYVERGKEYVEISVHGWLFGF